MRFNCNKRILFYIVFIASCVLLSSCKKNKPKPGEYTSEFVGTYIRDSIERTTYAFMPIEIVESNKDEIIFEKQWGDGAEYSIKKTGKNQLEGLLDELDGSKTHSQYDFYIKGSWEKVKGRSLIKGTFNSVLEVVGYSGMETKYYDVEGTFIIESKD